MEHTSTDLNYITGKRIPDGSKAEKEFPQKGIINDRTHILLCAPYWLKDDRLATGGP